MAWKLTMSSPAQAAMGTIYDPYGEGNGIFPIILIVWTEDKPAPSAKHGGSVPALLRKAVNQPVFGGDGYSEAEWLQEFRAGNAIEGYRGASEDEKLKLLVDYAKRQGVDVQFMPYEQLLAEHGDCQAYRIGNVAKVGTDYKGEAHSYEKLRALLLHELFSGYDHRNGDAAAQEKAKEFAERHGDSGAYEKLKEIDRLFELN